MNLGNIIKIDQTKNDLENQNQSEFFKISRKADVYIEVYTKNALGQITYQSNISNAKLNASFVCGYIVDACCTTHFEKTINYSLNELLPQISEFSLATFTADI